MIRVGLKATLDEAQELLKQAGYAQLYPKNKREAIIAHGIIHGTALAEINDKLMADEFRQGPGLLPEPLRAVGEIVRPSARHNGDRASLHPGRHLAGHVFPALAEINDKLFTEDEKTLF